MGFGNGAFQAARITIDGVTIIQNIETGKIQTSGVIVSTTTTTTTTQSNVTINAGQSTLTGTTAGSVVYSMPFQGTVYKKFVAYANGYENDTTTAQTITFPVAFSNVAGVTFNNTGLTLSTSLTALTISAPNSTTTYTGMIIVEGY